MCGGVSHEWGCFLTVEFGRCIVVCPENVKFDKTKVVYNEPWPDFRDAASDFQKGAFSVEARTCKHRNGV